jgi:hypothetical protein
MEKVIFLLVGDLFISPIDGAVYVVASFSDYSAGMIIAKSPTGASGTFTTHQVPEATIVHVRQAIMARSGGRIFVAGNAGLSGSGASGYSWGAWRSNNLLTARDTTIVITGTIGFNTRRDLRDLNNVGLLSSFDYFNNTFNSNAIFNQASTTVDTLRNPVMKMSISGVNERFTSNNIQIRFRDDSTFSYTDISKLGSYFSSSETGWVDFSYNFNSMRFPSMSFVSTDTSSSLVISASSGKCYAFKNIRLEFDQLMSNDGVIFYKNIDNQNNDKIFNYINSGIGVKVI